MHSVKFNWIVNGLYDCSSVNRASGFYPECRGFESLQSCQYIKMKRTKCEKCGYEFANKGGCYNRHVSACNGVYTPPGKAENCKHCGLFLGGMSASLIANHMRWCADNPKHAEYKEIARQQAPKNVGRVHSKETKERISKAHADGKYAHIDRAGMSLGRKHTDATKELLRIKALSSPHRRLRKKTIEYNGILLDSTWELALAKRLDDLNIKWIRPAPITWTDAEEKYIITFQIFICPITTCTWIQKIHTQLQYRRKNSICC